jgi:hypothetical protein
VATESSQRLGQATTAPTAPPPTMVPTPVPTPAPTNTPVPAPLQRTFEELSGSDLGVFALLTCSCCFSSGSSAYLEEGEVAAMPVVNSNVPDKGCIKFGDLQSVCNGNNEQKVRLLEITSKYNLLQQVATVNKAITARVILTTVEKNILTRYAQLVMVFFDLNIDLKILFTQVDSSFLYQTKYKFDCSKSDLTSYRGKKSIYLCQKFMNVNFFPDSNRNVFNSVFGDVIKNIYLLNYSYEALYEPSRSYDNCVLDKPFYSVFFYPFSDCYKYFMEAVYTINQCQDIACNVSSSQKAEYITSNYESVKDVFGALKDINSYEDLPILVADMYSAVMGDPNVNAPWNVMQEIFRKGYDMLNSKIGNSGKLSIVYGQGTAACDPNTHAYVYGRSMASTIFVCDKFTNSLKDLTIANFDNCVASEDSNNNECYTHFRTIAHEVSHLLGAEDNDSSGEMIYGYDECYSWAGTHDPFTNTNPAIMIADCVSFFVAQVYLCGVDDNNYCIR